MTYVKQQTLQEEAVLSGVGLHSGANVSMTISPARVDQGIVFVRTDMEEGRNVVPARCKNVVSSTLCTRIGNEHGAHIDTIEHLMSALRGCGIDNATIGINGSEVPAMDGSAKLFVEQIDRAGIIAQDKPRQFIRVLREVRVENNGCCVVLKPEEACIFESEINFEHPVIGEQTMKMELVNGNFRHDIAGARTFGFFSQIDSLRAAGLARGASLDNAIVFKDGIVLNEEGLRWKDECVRHKLLDAIGDLYLAGAQIIGRYAAEKPSHALNNALLQALFSDPANWEYAMLGTDESSGAVQAGRKKELEFV